MYSVENIRMPNKYLDIKSSYSLNRKKTNQSSSKSFTAMSPLRKGSNSQRVGIGFDNLIIAGTSYEEIILFAVDESTLEITEFLNDI